MLILTEKPSVAAAFAAALGVPRKGPVWENADHCIVNALGHLLEDFSPEDYDPALKKWTMATLPIVPEAVRYKPIEKTAEQLEVVRKCFRSWGNGSFLLATDAEREGEIIGAEIMDYVGFRGHAGAKRFWVSEALTPEVILAGIEAANPLSEYSSYRKQGFARQHADWLVGMNLTRLVSLKCGRTLHVGRVQTAVLGAVHERDKSIDCFIREKYVEVTATLMGEVGTFSVKLVNADNAEFPSRFPPGAYLPGKVDAARDTMRTGTVREIERERKIVQPPKLYNLTSLQKDAHKIYSYPPEMTLELVQTLYEKHKCLSYPRTPSRVMGDGNVELVKNIFGKLCEAFAGEAEGCDPEAISPGNKRLFNPAELRDHHALVPLDVPRENLSAEAGNVYMLVLRSFFRVLKPPHVYNSVRIKMEVSGFLFAGSGIEVLHDGWKAFADSGGDGDEPEGREDFSGIEWNKSYPVESVNAEERETEPRKRHTFASLLSLMENPRDGDGRHLVGLGTPATRGTILRKLVDRGYLATKGKSVMLSDDGKFLMDNIGGNERLSEFFSVPETTKWEERLQADTSAFIDGIRDFVRLAVAGSEMGTRIRQKIPLGKCPLCGEGVYEGGKSYYCGNYRGDEPCKFTVWKEICGAKVSDADVQTLLAGKKTGVRKCRSAKSGKEFNAAFALAEGRVEFVFDNSAHSKPENEGAGL